MVTITIYAKQKKRHMYRTDSWTLWEKARWDDLREQHQNMYVIYSETDHQPRLDAGDKCSDLVCTGKTQRDRVEREVGGGIAMGNTCKSMANSSKCMTKTTTIL